MIAKAGRASRGRPRQFDLEEALATGQALFHEHGYASVGLAAITGAIGIKAPSFYAAFGCKTAFLEKVLERYSASALPFDTIFRDGRDPAEAIADLLETAARVYTASPRAPGCLVVETSRSGADPQSCEIARRIGGVSRSMMLGFIAGSHPAMAGAVTDYVVAVMSGMSAGAREGWSAERLLAVAQGGSAGVAALLKPVAPSLLPPRPQGRAVRTKTPKATRE